MVRTVGIGQQDFADIRRENLFYIDKTHFIKEWWESKDSVTLITRPRRFGKNTYDQYGRAFFFHKICRKSRTFYWNENLAG